MLCIGRSTLFSLKLYFLHLSIKMLIIDWYLTFTEYLNTISLQESFSVRICGWNRPRFLDWSIKWTLHSFSRFEWFQDFFSAVASTHRRPRVGLKMKYFVTTSLNDETWEWRFSKKRKWHKAGFEPLCTFNTLKWKQLLGSLMLYPIKYTISYN